MSSNEEKIWKRKFGRKKKGKINGMKWKEEW
jgi:hypothetical protein